MGSDNSFITMSSLCSAFQSVKENHGCAGVDGETIEKFEADLDTNLEKLYNELLAHTYSPLPLLKILVDKGNGEARPLCIPTVRDRVAQSAVLHYIEPILDKEFEACSFAYRKGHSVREAINKIKKYYERGYHFSHSGQFVFR
ncbi:MAG: hypothetical protein ACMUJM_22315 [bacterium]